MFTTNPFALLNATFDPLILQIYALAMVAAVLAGTALDIIHKRSGAYFSQRRAKSRAAAQRDLGVGETAWLAVKTIAVEVITAGEFCKWQRRVSHLLMMYGFIAYLFATVVMIFVYPTTLHPPRAIAAAWTIGALMVLSGGAWFFFILKVNVAHEKQSPFHLVQADLFIGSLLLSVASGLLWHLAQTLEVAPIATWVLFGLYILCTTLLFVSVRWSKFAHMFYKPVVAFQKRLEEASGATDLPARVTHSNIKG